jgi:hypothetical protein
MPATAPALRAPLPDLTRIAVGLVVWNTRKIPFFSSLKNSRSEDGGQGRAALWRVHRSEAKTLDGDAAEATRAKRAARLIPPRLFLFNTFTRGNRRLLSGNRKQPIFLLAA